MKNYKNSRLILLTAIILMLSSLSRIYAAIEHQNGSMAGPYIANSTSFTVADPRLNNTSGFTNVVANDIVSVVIDKANTTYTSQFSGTVTLKIDQYSDNNTFITSTTVTLAIEYNPAGNTKYINNHSYKFTGSYKNVITFEGTNLSTIPSCVMITCDIWMERYFNFDLTNTNTSYVPSISINLNAPSSTAGIGELAVS